MTKVKYRHKERKTDRNIDRKIDKKKGNNIMTFRHQLVERTERKT